MGERYAFKQPCKDDPDDKLSNPEQPAAGPKWRTFLTGICALSPGGPDTAVEKRDVAGPLHVVMPASTSRTSSRLPAITIPVHLPFAIVPTQYLSPTNNRHVDLRLTDKDGNDQAIFLFSRERLSFEHSQNGPLTFPQSNRAPGERPTNDQDATDVNWIADLRKIWLQASNIRNECLPTSAVFPVPATVAAQLTIGRGTVKTAFPSAEHPISTFEPDKGILVSQAITRQCVVEQDLPGGEFELLSASMDTQGASMTSIKLQPVAGTDLEITIGNADFEDILAIAAKSVTPSSVAVDVDFELYRPILKTPDDSAFPVPVIIGRQAGHDNCPVVRSGGGG